MAKHLFTKDNQPQKRGRGPDWRTKILAALAEDGKTEDDFIKYVLARAFNPDDELSSKMIDVIINRLAPINKAVMPMYGLTFEPGSTPADKIDAVIDAVAAEQLPADVANMLTAMIKTGIDVREVTELAERLERLEQLISERAKEE